MQRRSARLSNNNSITPVTHSISSSIRKPSPSILSNSNNNNKEKKLKREQEDTPIIKNNNNNKRVKKNNNNSKLPPDNWKVVFDRIKLYRQQHEAVVDTMGCACLAEKDVPPKQQRFQTLVSLMLSSQTKDTVTSVAVKTLQKQLPGGLCIDSILEIDDATFDKYIYSVGFHTKKVKYIKQTAAILREKYDDDIPDTIEGLTSLPGVGPKMGYLTLQVAWKKNLGIGVDVHVHRISNRLGWCHTEKGGPEDTRISLQSWLPKEHWQEINPILVGFGQILCFPRGPKCEECPVNDLCPASTVKRKIKKEISVKKEIKEENKITESIINEIDIKLEAIQDDIEKLVKKEEEQDDHKIKKVLDW